ncbi:MAG: tetratricopeptide repeat protein [Sphingomonadales bacterium]|nr:tetratricopeptide repeat protein [Sphingomonadales bacterium]
MKWCYAKWLVLALLIVGWAISISVAAQEGVLEELPVDDGVLGNAERYQNCVATAHENSQAAFDVGTKWRDEGGGLPAQHCVALSLVGLGLYENAAEQLEVIASDLRLGRGLDFVRMIASGNRKVLADVYMQAGNVWLLAERSIMAYDVFSLGLFEVEADSEQALEIYVDRARASGFGGDFDLAIEDLQKANELSPERADILIFLATAQRLLEKFDDAAQTLEQALSIFPDNPEILLERGNLRFDMGDVDAARLDWVVLLSLHPDSYSGQIARSNIEKLNELEEGGHITPPNIEGDN